MKVSFAEFDRRLLELSWLWLKDPEIKQLTLAPDFTREEQLKWFSSLPRQDYLIWSVWYESVPVGATGLKNITADDAEYWGYIGDKRYWGLGIGREMVAFVLAEAARRMLKSVYLRVSRENARAVALYTKMGFLVEREDGPIIVMRRKL